MDLFQKSKINLKNRCSSLASSPVKRPPQEPPKVANRKLQPHIFTPVRKMRTSFKSSTIKPIGTLVDKLFEIRGTAGKIVKASFAISPRVVKEEEKSTCEDEEYVDKFDYLVDDCRSQIAADRRYFANLSMSPKHAPPPLRRSIH